MYYVEETEDGPEVHGLIPDTDKIIIAALLVAFFPAGALYWWRAANQADDQALAEWERDQIPV